jgi:hypothetical protein
VLLILIMAHNVANYGNPTGFFSKSGQEYYDVVGYKRPVTQKQFSIYMAKSKSKVPGIRAPAKKTKFDRNSASYQRLRARSKKCTELLSAGEYRSNPMYYSPMRIKKQRPKGQGAFQQFLANRMAISQPSRKRGSPFGQTQGRSTNPFYA